MSCWTAVNGSYVMHLYELEFVRKMRNHRIGDRDLEFLILGLENVVNRIFFCMIFFYTVRLNIHVTSTIR